MAVYRYGKKVSDINVQSDFNITNTTDDAYIKNRPDSTLKISLDGVVQSKSYNPNTGNETINIDLGPTITNQNNRVDEIIANLDVASVGGNDKYISTISEEDGKIHATAVFTASTFSSSGTTAINGKGVNAALLTLNAEEVGGVGEYIEVIKEQNGIVVASAANMDSTPTTNSFRAVSSNGIKSYVDNSISTEVTNRNTAITNAINNLDKSLIGSDGSYIKTIKEENGLVIATKQTFDTSISSDSTDNNAPTTLAVYNAIQSLGNVYNIRDSVANFDSLPSTGNKKGDVRNVNDTGDNYVWTGDGWDALGGSTVLHSLDYSGASSSGTATQFITNVTQSDGLISATKSSLPTSSTTTSGIVQLDDTLESSSTTNAATANAVKTVNDSINTHIADKDNPHNVTKDQIGLGDVPNFDTSNAIVSITRSGTTFIATHLNGGTDTFTQQDNDTTYNVVSTSENGLVSKLPTENATTKFLRGDGNWEVPPGVITKIETVTTTNSTAYTPDCDTRYFIKNSNITLTLGNATKDGLMITVIAGQSSGNATLKFGTETLTLTPSSVQILYSRANSNNYISGLYGALWN